MKKVFLLSVIAATALMSCSKQDSEKVELTFSPETPKVKFAKGNVQTGSDDNGPTFQEVKAPWFKFNLTVQNGADKNVIVESLVLKFTGLSTTDVVVVVEKTVAVDSSIPALTTTVLADVTAGTTSAATVDLYVQELSPLVTSGVYSVEVTAQGWFGTLNDPVSVYSQKYFFTTR